MILLLTCFDPEIEKYFQLGKDSLIYKVKVCCIYTTLVVRAFYLF